MSLLLRHGVFHYYTENSAASFVFGELSITRKFGQQRVFKRSSAWEHDIIDESKWTKWTIDLKFQVLF